MLSHAGQAIFNICGETGVAGFSGRDMLHVFGSHNSFPRYLTVAE